jgi:hypothetical protein
VSVANKITAAYRWPEDVKEQIQKRARAFGLTETEYVKRAALGELDADPCDIITEIAEIKKRLKTIEDLAFGLNG